MKTQRTQALLAAAALSFMSVGVYAQTTQPMAQTSAASQFDKLDVNKDGGVDKNEAKTMRGLGDAFDKADINKDGKLDSSEFEAAVSSPKS